ncbi:PBURS-like protein [Mya arenaria]|uniref:PBURS-like protein n=1 Tax=Mya arenaria TaxID=6604 RepID=A0ABY7D711_MYAAR|nr:PBURS-like protein [Mya arenaria]
MALLLPVLFVIVFHHAILITSAHTFGQSRFGQIDTRSDTLRHKSGTDESSEEYLENILKTPVLHRVKFSVPVPDGSDPNLGLYQTSDDVSSKAISHKYMENMFLYNLLMSRALLRPMNYNFSPGKYGYPIDSILTGSKYSYAKRDDIETDGIKVTPPYPIEKNNRYNNRIDINDGKSQTFRSHRFVKRASENKLDKSRNSSDNVNASSEINNKPHNADELKYSSDILPPPQKRPSGDVEQCKMETVEMDMRFRQYIDTHNGPLLLTCTGRVTINKCEGLCRSLVRPDVTAYDGFERSCNCCKDVSRRRTPVTFSICDINSNEVFGYDITRDITEPTECACLECSRY